MDDENKVIEKRCFSEKNISKFNTLLKDMFIEDILQHTSTNAGYNLFIKRYLEIYNHCILEMVKKTCEVMT